MLVETDVAGQPVLVVGPVGLTGAAVRRLVRAGAKVSVASSAGEVTADRVAGMRLAVVVGPADGWDEAMTVLTAHCLVVREATPTRARARVVLVGAGPGSAGLLTLDAVRALADADVVLTDRLAQVGDLAALAPGAEVIDVGKRPGHHSVPQDRIEQLMVERALRGLTVVRLKGGDPYLFGRGGEEVEAAVAAGLPVTVVPGVSSAIAVPGSAGIPVTHRGVSHLVTVVSGHVPLDEAQAGALAALGGTIAVLMGVHNLVPIAASLTRAGLDPQTPAAVVERGLTPDQRSVVGTLGSLPALAARSGVASPAVIVIGEVVRCSEVWARRVDADRLDGVA
ncbi:uroporphyrin-III methyltransferase [Intrasporangium oryzae NRRL B-24470]|uniref:uroporphyrinogen-III C-methyltransferase n=1 Tax=Intrasporangium oryzae NRRL B-24470 TaxID=1386089 RepID=W9G0S4_9MICO|nr:uroporphyrinogen-III C-methyltransferase [Intrasporangium oryzae]EWS99680.1 uroporphyrin-III methyltransferase [Intrasporangium oryzae NRRL B-24470]